MIDDDSAADAGTSSPNTQRVGRRLAIIREELGKFYQESEWSQTAVGARVGLTQNIITRMEHGKGGLMENWLKVLNLYEQHGYNLNWILTENNERVSKLLINESTIGQVRDDLLEKITELRGLTLQGIDALHEMVQNVPSSDEATNRPTPNAEPDLSFLND